MRKLIIVLAATATLAHPVTAQPALRDVASIDNALFDLGVADIIRKQCPDVSARMVRALRYARNLQKQARALGYSDAQIDAYLDSDADKARLRRKAASYFKANGVDTSDPQSYCALGRAEIQKSSRIGSLLKAK